MKTKIPRELKRSFLLFLWLLLAQTVCALFTLLASILALVSMALGGSLALSGHTPLWVWIGGGALVCLFWLMMGRLTPRPARPGFAGTAAVLAVWAVLTSLIRGDLPFLAQRLCGGMLEEILQSLRYGCRVTFDRELDLAIGCFLLSAVFGMGLLWGWKRAAAATPDK